MRAILRTRGLNFMGQFTLSLAFIGSIVSSTLYGFHSVITGLISIQAVY